MNEPTMKPLPNEFRSDGFDFTVLARQGKVALLAKTKSGLSRYLYEVVIVQERPESQFKGLTFPAHEAMPPSESWGTRGWTPYDWDRAWRLFEQRVVEFGQQSTPRHIHPHKNRFEIKGEQTPRWPVRLIRVAQERVVTAKHYQDTPQRQNASLESFCPVLSGGAV